MNAKHVQIDLETLGTLPGSVILSIGAVMFDPALPPDQCIDKEFYCVVNKASSLAAGLTVDDDTLKWWNDKSPEARRVLDDAENEGVSHDLAVALIQLAEFIPQGAFIWSNGANFDQPLLEVAYDRINIDLPWKFYNSRCYRTIKGLHPNEKSLAPAKVCAHHALEDAIWQTKHLVALAQALNLKL